MPAIGRRQFLEGPAVVAAVFVTGCPGEGQLTSDGAADPLEEPHRLTIGDVREESPTRFPLTLSCEFTDTRIEANDPAVLEATLQNTGSEPVTIRSDPVWPFGVPYLIREDSEGFQRVTAWNDAFAESPHLTTRDRSVESWEDVYVEDGIDAGETIHETYEIYHDSPDISAGTYRSWVSLRATDGNRTASYEVSFDSITIEPIDEN